MTPSPAYRYWRPREPGFRETRHISGFLFLIAFGFIIELSPKKQHYDEYEQESGAVAHLHAK